MKKNNWFTRHQWLSLTSIVAIFSVIVFGNINRWSIWFDEGFSAYLMRFNFAEITHFTALDVHPPFYYWLLKIWTLVFGASPLALRSMSWFFAVVALVGVFLLVRRALGSRGYALAATLGFSLTPLLIRYADEARMYTLVLAIVVWATYLLLRATQSKSWKVWIGYGLLVVAGMLTHYLIALAWVAHWIWRFYIWRRGEIERFFTKQWLVAYGLAVALFTWWLPSLYQQFTTVQGGFWIPPINTRTPIDFLTNALLYRQGSEITNWLAIVGLAVVIYVIWAAYFAIKNLRRKQSTSVALLATIAIVPPILLVLISMPPLKSTFVDRYALYSACFLMALAAVGTVILASKRSRLAVLGVAILCAGAVVGSASVYQFGNYNKNSDTSIRTYDTIRLIDAVGSSGQPTVTGSPWLYFEAAPYSTTAHPIYYTADSVTANYGSLAMLKERNIGRIESLRDFAKSHRYIWYLDNPDGEFKAPISTWTQINQVSVYDSISGTSKYRAVLYDTATN